MHIKKFQGLVATIIVGAVPVVLWFVFNPAAIDYSTNIAIANVVARVTAVAAISLFAFNVILSARLAIFERLFLGLDRTYRAHRLIGGSVLALLLIHAMAVTFKYSSSSLVGAYEFLKPGTNLALSIGSIALFVMISAVIVSVYIKVKYQWFVTTQRVLGAMIIFGTYHSLFAKGSDLQLNLPLLLFLGAMEMSAIMVYLYRSIFHNSFKQEYQYTVDSVKSDQGILDVWLKPVNGQISYSAGQFAFFKFDSQAVDSESHPFSFGSGSADDRIRIVVKDDGDYTHKLFDIKAGDIATVEGPYGYFTLNRIKSANQVWMAGGIGIAPFLSLAHSLPSDRKATLYYCVATQAQAIFRNELEQIAAKSKNFKVITICSDTDGRINGKTMIDKSAGDYLLCASLPFMQSIKAQLIAEGIKASNIHYEEFGLK